MLNYLCGHNCPNHSPAAEQIAQEGFTKGVGLQDASTLVKTEGGSGGAGFNYAFDVNHPNPTWQGGKAVVFPGHFLNVSHHRNEDNYVIFDGREIPPEQIFPIVNESKTIDGKYVSGWSVYDASGRKLIDSKPLKEVINWITINHGTLEDVKKKTNV